MMNAGLTACYRRLLSKKSEHETTPRCPLPQTHVLPRQLCPRTWACQRYVIGANLSRISQYDWTSWQSTLTMQSRRCGRWLGPRYERATPPCGGWAKPRTSQRWLRDATGHSCRRSCEVKYDFGLLLFESHPGIYMSSEGMSACLKL